ncbi:hypothetical protein DSO57_1030509 [Entomophthora muscae]|uniref:Uncharacterized protein n=1 Tax=Entomophthora muscae TaxID=34485 RepID=A0ACC2TC05_9FUNG|nr:hypothetical protein DSO57_1030509 [Entomophthora muscae]
MTLELLQVPNLGSSSPIFGFGEISFWGFLIGQFPHLAGVDGPAVGGVPSPAGWLVGGLGVLRQFPQSGGTAAFFILLFKPNCAQKFILTQGVVRNIPDSQAHVAACFCFPVEHTISYLLDNFGRAVGKLAVADATAVKKTKILLTDFRLAGVPTRRGSCKQWS